MTMSEVIAIPLGAIRPTHSPFRAGLDTPGGFSRTTAAAPAAPRDDYARGFADGVAEAEGRAKTGEDRHDPHRRMPAGRLRRAQGNR